MLIHNLTPAHTFARAHTHTNTSHTLKHRDRGNVEGLNDKELPLDPIDPAQCW